MWKDVKKGMWHGVLIVILLVLLTIFRIWADTEKSEYRGLKYLCMLVQLVGLLLLIGLGTLLFWVLESRSKSTSLGIIIVTLTCPLFMVLFFLTLQFTLPIK